MGLSKDDLQCKQKYLSGIKLATESIRKYEIEITSKKSAFFKEIVILEVHTKKKRGEWQAGESIYYFPGVKGEKETLEELLKTKYKF